MSSIAIESNQVSAVSPEGVRKSISVRDLLHKAVSHPIDTGDFVLSDGIKSIKSCGNVSILIHETPTQVFSLRWIAPDSPARFGYGCQYRSVRIALPYLITLAVFQTVRRRLTLSKVNECFFSNRPLASLDDAGLSYPALLNCSRFDPPDGKPLAWICTQHMERRTIDAETDTNRRFRLALAGLMQTLLGSGFNYSSEFHEASSWYSESVRRSIDPRIATIEAWQEATSADPLFVLDVNWLPVNMTLRQVTARIFKNLGAREDRCTNVSDLMRVIFND